MKARGRKSCGNEEPEVFPDLVFIWEAFLALSSARLYGEPIKFSEIISYMDISGINSEDIRQELTHLVRILDIEYFKHLTEKEKRNAKSFSRNKCS